MGSASCDFFTAMVNEASPIAESFPVTVGFDDAGPLSGGRVFTGSDHTATVKQTTKRVASERTVRSRIELSCEFFRPGCRE